MKNIQTSKTLKFLSVFITTLTIFCHFSEVQAETLSKQGKRIKSSDVVEYFNDHSSKMKQEEAIDLLLVIHVDQTVLCDMTNNNSEIMNQLYRIAHQTPKQIDARIKKMLFYWAYDELKKSDERKYERIMEYFREYLEENSKNLKCYLDLR